MVAEVLTNTDVIDLILKMHDSFQGSFDSFLFKIGLVITLFVGAIGASTWFQHKRTQASTKDIEIMKKELRESFGKTESLKHELESKLREVETSITASETRVESQLKEMYFYSNRNAAMNSFAAGLPGMALLHFCSALEHIEAQSTNGGERAIYTLQHIYDTLCHTPKNKLASAENSFEPLELILSSTLKNFPKSDSSDEIRAAVKRCQDKIKELKEAHNK